MCWLNSTEETLETYATNMWLEWGSHILQIHATYCDKHAQAEATAIAAQSKVAYITEKKACWLANEQRMAKEDHITGAEAHCLSNEV